MNIKIYLHKKIPVAENLKKGTAKNKETTGIWFNKWMSTIFREDLWAGKEEITF